MKKRKNKKHNKRKKGKLIHFTNEQNNSQVEIPTSEDKKDDKANMSICCICNKPIKDLSTSIIEKKSKKEAHFDCVIKQINKTEKLNVNESICYIGSGYFAIIKQKKNKFSIIKKINYEEKNLSKEN